jgi:hypothetical protein
MQVHGHWFSDDLNEYRYIKTAYESGFIGIVDSAIYAMGANPDSSNITAATVGNPKSPARIDAETRPASISSYLCIKY